MNFFTANKQIRTLEREDTSHSEERNFRMKTILDQSWNPAVRPFFRCFCRLTPFDKCFEEATDSPVIISSVSLNKQLPLDDVVWT